tara:strand:+ start:81 stop:590 length:510 start_codon:yes stop_codon:yes gene_type:complete
MKKNKAVFLDRDGTINKNFGYVHQVKNFIFLKKVITAIRFLKNKGYKVVVVTNQSGVDRGYFKLRDVTKLHKWINYILKKNKTKIDKFYVSTYHPNFSKNNSKAYLRKPKPGMLIKAKKDLNIDLNKSFMIGDSKTDQLAAKKVNLLFVKKRANLLTCAKSGLAKLSKS